MKPVLPMSVPVDRVRMIRRSIRCFLFGLMGAVPLFGVGAAILALRLQRQLAEEAGEPARRSAVNGATLVACALVLMFRCYDQAGLVLALGILLSAVQGWLLSRQYRRMEPVEWNPARHLAYWGAGLAYAGLNLSVTMVLLLIESAIPHR
jgi:hypothetical protein